MSVLNSTIIEQKSISDEIFRMTLHAPGIAQLSLPGQFIHIKINSSIDLLLRRPFSVHRCDSETGKLEILYRVVGKGTQIMAEMISGESLNLIGPLGNPFRIDDEFQCAIVVAGGLGCAPVHFLIDSLLEKKKEVHFFWGTCSEKEFFDLDKLKEKGVSVYTSTEDGSHGHLGFITSLLETHISLFSKEDTIGFACGPLGMYKAIKRILYKNLFSWQISLEEQMACGIGVCQGCAVWLKSGDVKMICTDGPVFDLQEIDFDG